MPEYRIAPSHEFGRGFVLWSDAQCIATVVELSKGDFEVRVGEERYRIVTSTGFTARHELLSEEAEVLATAERPSPIGPRYAIRTADRVAYDVVPVATYGRKCHVIRDETIVGVIDPDDITTREVTSTLPDDVEPAEAAFLVWIVLNAGTA